MRAHYCTNPIETKHTFIVPRAIGMEVILWCERQFGESTWETWYAMSADTAADIGLFILDDDQALQFRLRWC
ncbi:MAG: hypothetical protein EOP83_16260 [Verrucomicrobiaceae bacterium]|nr:MAG: hypothetical protein EOP83_16260 [Verrucomicrobiaceae bacterium]